MISDRDVYSLGWRNKNQENIIQFIMNTGMLQSLLSPAVVREYLGDFRDQRSHVLNNSGLGFESRVRFSVSDSFLRNRSSMDHEATAMMKAQFMSLWDGLDTAEDSQVPCPSPIIPAALLFLCSCCVKLK